MLETVSYKVRKSCGQASAWVQRWVGMTTLGFGKLRVLQLAIHLPPVCGSLSDGHTVRFGDNRQDGDHFA